MARTTEAVYVERCDVAELSQEQLIALAQKRAEANYWSRIEQAVESSRTIDDYRLRQIVELIAIRDAGIEGTEHTRVVNELADCANGYSVGAIYISADDFPKLRKLYPHVLIGSALTVWNAEKAEVVCQLDVGETELDLRTIRVLPPDCKCRIETTTRVRVENELVCKLE